jgi:hypothetical protein
VNDTHQYGGFLILKYLFLIYQMIGYVK